LTGLLCVALLAACGDSDPPLPGPAYPRDNTLRLNHIQVVGTHNSYHIQPSPALFEQLRRRLGSLADPFEYSHPPLDVQFETQGVRQIELDVFADPNGGLFAKRVALRFIGQDTASGIPALNDPGFKVLHVQDIDFDTTCLTLISCLQTVKTWSQAHPGHVPLMILVEAKDDTIPVGGAAIPVKIDAVQLDALDAEIRSVFSAQEMITPDEVRGTHATLDEAVRTDGWPTLGQSRGRVLFTLDNEGAVHDAYIAGHPALRGRVIFTTSPPGTPEAAFVKLNDPIADFDTIRQDVAAGFVVRTRADADTVQARSNDTTMRDMALASGAQWVSTDYPVPDPSIGTGYQVTIPMGAPGRCNPISAARECTPTDIENPQHLSSR
jgi:calcium-dependent phosphoinositide phospholipase C